MIRQLSLGAGRAGAMLAAAAVFTGTAVASPPAALASARHAAMPTAVSLDSSDKVVKSTTTHSVNVAIEASNNPSTPANDSLVVVLSKGAENTGETHIWSFPITSSVLEVQADGSGVLLVPAKDIAPFGAVRLRFKPIGKITSRRCGGAVVSKSVPVSLTGIFYFDSMSTGKHAWGAVGSKKSFTFASTNVVTWLYSLAASASCPRPATPCAAGVTWTAQANGVSFVGVEAPPAGTATIHASRAVSLAKPDGAVRDDTNVGQTAQPTITGDDGESSSPTLTVSGNGQGVTGTATITGDAPTTQINAPCGNGQTQVTRFFTGEYANGSSDLTVAEQIFGVLTVTDNSDGTVDETEGS